LFSILGDRGGSKGGQAGARAPPAIYIYIYWVIR